MHKLIILFYFQFKPTFVCSCIKTGAAIILPGIKAVTMKWLTSNEDRNVYTY